MVDFALKIHQKIDLKNDKNLSTKKSISRFLQFFFSEFWLVLFAIFKCFYRPNIVKINVVLEDAQCSETDFCIPEFFCTTFNFWDISDFVFDIHSETVWVVCNPDSDANRWGSGPLSKSMRGPEAQYRWGCWRRSPIPKFFLMFKKILNSSKSWMHYEGKIQNRPCLKK